MSEFNPGAEISARFELANPKKFFQNRDIYRYSHLQTE